MIISTYPHESRKDVSELGVTQDSLLSTCGSLIFSWMLWTLIQPFNTFCLFRLARVRICFWKLKNTKTNKQKHIPYCTACVWLELRAVTHDASTAPLEFVTQPSTPFSSFLSLMSSPFRADTSDLPALAWVHLVNTGPQPGHILRCNCSPPEAWIWNKSSLYLTVFSFFMSDLCCVLFLW